MNMTLLDQYADLRGRKQSLDSQSKTLGGELARFEVAILEGMAEEGIDQIKRKGMTFFLTSRIQTKSIGDTSEAAARLIADGYEFLATLNHMRVKSYIAESQVEGEIELTVPEELRGVVEATRVTRLGCRKA